LMFLADDLANNEGSFSKLEDVIINWARTLTSGCTWRINSYDS
jgi:hypothetical protein